MKLAAKCVKNVSFRAICDFVFPTFVSNEVPRAGLVICPYNYIVEPTIAQMIGLSLKNRIVIVDEAHNFDSNLRDSGSLTIKLYTFKENLIHLDAVERYHMLERGAPTVLHAFLTIKQKLHACWSVLKQYRDDLIRDENMSNDERRAEPHSRGEVTITFSTSTY